MLEYVDDVDPGKAFARANRLAQSLELIAANGQHRNEAICLTNATAAFSFRESIGVYVSMASRIAIGIDDTPNNWRPNIRILSCSS